MQRRELRTSETEELTDKERVQSTAVKHQKATYESWAKMTFFWGLAAVQTVLTDTVLSEQAWNSIRLGQSPPPLAEGVCGCIMRVWHECATVSVCTQALFPLPWRSKWGQRMQGYDECRGAHSRLQTKLILARAVRSQHTCVPGRSGCGSGRQSSRRKSRSPMRTTGSLGSTRGRS